jgi:hypothetical protein
VFSPREVGSQSINRLFHQVSSMKLKAASGRRSAVEMDLVSAPFADLRRVHLAEKGAESGRPLLVPSHPR